MHQQGFTITAIISLSLSCIGSMAFADNQCPPLLKQLQTQHLSTASNDLCHLQDRYQRALDSLKSQGVLQPERIANLRGPRFINGPFWQSQAAANSYNPWVMYKPAPQTWQSWEVSQKWVNELISKNIAQQKIQPISIDWIQGMHKEAMTIVIGKGGSFRTGNEVGLSLSRKAAVTAPQIEQIKTGGGFHSPFRPDQPLYTWHATVCFEDQTPEVLQQIKERTKAGLNWLRLTEWPDIDSQQFFTDENGEQKQCGYTQYSRAYEVYPELQRWTNYIAQTTAEWGTETQGPSEDLLVFVARLQRWFIGIHPFADGNGRTSRNVVDVLFKSLQLPAPTLENMDLDIYLSETEWADEIGKGLVRATKLLRLALKIYRRPVVIWSALILNCLWIMNSNW